MPNQKLRPSDASRYLKAVRDAGFQNGRLIKHPDGRIELIGEDSPSKRSSSPLSPFEQWEADNANTS
ncbi:hypothetical protein GCM10009077_38170 [Roseibium denhamense]|uniref:Uncharacterized protein n=1 Tax=Roseibium denhamense TaxID=76305 RepID=A0ABY1PA29_9HYPH|nr:hypothetical protein SAMN06265374_3134 [Roseibium denhamense]